MFLLLLFGEMHDNIIVVVCVSRQQKCGRLAGGVMVLVAGASHILAASTHTATPRHHYQLCVYSAQHVLRTHNMLLCCTVSCSNILFLHLVPFRTSDLSLGVCQVTKPPGVTEIAQ